MGHSVIGVCAVEDSTGDRPTLHSPQQEIAINMTTTKPVDTTEDNDIHKGATEDDRPAAGQSSHPGLDNNGLPNDPVAIAQDKLGANDDESQG
jgi:hypothetical protein